MDGYILKMYEQYNRGSTYLFRDPWKKIWPKLIIDLKSIIFASIKYWNKLKLEIKSIQEYYKFKSALKHIYFIN